MKYLLASLVAVSFVSLDSVASEDVYPSTSAATANLSTQLIIKRILHDSMSATAKLAALGRFVKQGDSYAEVEPRLGKPLEVCKSESGRDATYFYSSGLIVQCKENKVQGIRFGRGGRVVILAE